MVSILFILGFFLVVLQMFLPDWQLIHARPLLLPVLAVYAALRFDLPKALGVSAGLGLILDLFSTGKIGLSSIGFLLLTLFIASQAENFKFDYAPHALLMTLLGVFVYLLVDYLFFCLEVMTWRWPQRVWWDMVCQCLLDTTIALPIFWWLDALGRWCVARRIDKPRNLRP